MGDILRLILEYQCLERKRQASKGVLAPGERARHTALQRLVSQPPEGESDVPRRYARIGLSLPATYLRGERSLPVVVRDLGGGGVALESSEPFALGEVGVLSYADADAEEGFQGRVLGQIVWKRRDRAGMVFTGMPHLG